jgi:hypothetical protein
MLHVVVQDCSLDSEVTAIPITLASETYVYMRVVRIGSGIWTPLPSSNFRRYQAFMYNVLDALIPGFGSFNDGNCEHARRL